eukprot:m.24594 g.24594  ORF g.24594 m.24594 type:complete len:500 (-) comp7622_c1_seq1:55-1554(-)
MQAIKIPRVVPWTDFDEWTEVQRLLLSEQFDERKAGVQRVQVWATRTEVPLAVECTRSFVHVQLLDEEGNTADTVLRHLYSLAILRFVNGFCDAEQKGRTARSVQGLSEDLGIPVFLVDLRHEATHTTMPTLQALRFAIPHALRWLEENYWKKQLVHLQATKDIIKDLLKQFLDLSRTKGKKKQDIEAHLELMTSQISPSSLGRQFIPVLFLEGFMIPNVDDPKDFNKKCKELRKIWMPAIEKFQDTWINFVPMLAANAVSIIKDTLTCDEGLHTGNTGKAAAFAVNLPWKKRSHMCTWLAHWGHQLLLEFQLEHSLLVSLLRDCLDVPCSYLKQMLQTILEQLDLDKNPKVSQELLVELFCAASDFPTELFSNDSSNGIGQEFSAELNQFSQHVADLARKTKPSDTNVPENEAWTLVTDKKWVGVPLGALPGGVPSHPVLDLKLGDQDDTNARGIKRGALGDTVESETKKQRNDSKGATSSNLSVALPILDDCVVKLF